jgi:hypothetical protein
MGQFPCDWKGAAAMLALIRARSRPPGRWLTLGGLPLTLSISPSSIRLTSESTMLLAG